MNETLTVRIDSETMKRLERVSKSSRRSKSLLAAEAIGAFVDSEEWRLGEIAIGIQELDAGEGVSHEKVSKWLQAWGRAGEINAPG